MNPTLKGKKAATMEEPLSARIMEGGMVAGPRSTFGQEEGDLRRFFDQIKKNRNSGEAGAQVIGEGMVN